MCGLVLFVCSFKSKLQSFDNINPFENPFQLTVPTRCGTKSTQLKQICLLLN